MQWPGYCHSFTEIASSSFKFLFRTCSGLVTSLHERSGQSEENFVIITVLSFFTRLTLILLGITYLVLTFNRLCKISGNQIYFYIQQKNTKNVSDNGLIKYKVVLWNFQAARVIPVYHVKNISHCFNGCLDIKSKIYRRYSPHIAQCSSNFYISNKLLDELTLFSAVYKLSSVHALRGYKGFTF